MAAILVNPDTAQNVVTTTPDPESVLIYVGENVRRYTINGECYIRPNIDGINYKNRDLYTPPKLLIRKTGLGIYGAIDYTGSMTSQTVYILKYADPNNATPLEYYLALLNSRVVYYYYLKVKVLVIQSCLTLWDPMDCSPPGSSVHGILQERILEWVAMPSSRGSSRPTD